MARTLESEEAARRLGVKTATLYAYVSRGRLRSYPAPDSRRSLFDADEVEALARRRRVERRGAEHLLTITTGISQLRSDGPFYRGHPAVELAQTSRFEAVAELLWAEDAAAPPPWPSPRTEAPPPLGPADLLRWVVVVTGAGDPLRSDERPDAVRRAARRLIATMAVALEASSGRSVSPEGTSIAERVARALGSTDPTAHTAAVDAALVLLADHELATSTIAVRVAASTRADLYDAVLAGLGTLAGPLHGGASLLARDLLDEVERRGPEQALDHTLRWRGTLPGFGHLVYAGPDPRLGVLLDHVERIASPDQRRLLAAVLALASARDLPPPNVDLGLAALTWAIGMPADAGRTLFTVARLAGWTAHYLEELTERPLRFRARAVYASPTNVPSPAPDGDGRGPPTHGDAGAH